jgi:2-polyprenyl-3-methyl-5-hydroxy-6-metoxy-1,4-benzoquinol methylase
VPFDSDRFDVVIVRSVMEHVAEPELVFSEIARVLKPGALVLMNLPNKWDYVSIVARLARGFKSTLLRRVLQPSWDDFPVHYRANTRRDLSRAIESSGLQIESFRPLPSEPAYLSFFVPFYLLGAVYQFVISIFALDLLQPSFLVILRKPCS